MKKAVITCPKCGAPMKMVQSQYVYPVSNDMRDIMYTYCCEKHGYFGVLASDYPQIKI